MLRHLSNPPRFRPGRAGVLAAALVLVVPLSFAFAQNCQVPLFVMQSGTGANVMILADNSGSMNEAIYHRGYDPQATYDGLFDSAAMYFVAKDGERAPSNFNPAWPTTPRAYLVNSDNGENGRYIGNYLNWIYFHATEDQLAQLPTTTRIQVLKAVLCDLIDATAARLRLGLTVYQNDHGGSIIGNCGVNPVSLKAQVNGITANAWTPTGESMETILDYFTNDGPNAVIEEACQYNFLIVVTDGFPTMDREVSSYLHDADGDGNDPGSCESIGSPYNDESHHCTDHMDDVAYYMAHTDLRSDLEDDQIVHTYTIGYHIDAPLLEETAANGDGLYFTAENAVELRASIEWALQDIIRRISSGSAVAVVSTERGTDDRLYRGKFMPVAWEGYLEAYELPYEAGDNPVWDAGNLLAHRAPSDRLIMTAIGSSVFPFIAGNADDLWLHMGAVNEDEAAALIRWGRGENEPDLRDRGGWKLGDIISSTPVVVGAASQFSPEESYQEYFAQTVTRQRMIYVGANDGMIHAFNADNGREEWAFVPEFALPVFKDMATSAST
jgi:type IV pilus assembly protein PilY1